MQAVVQDRYGSADVVRLARIDRPEVGDRDVLLQVNAAGLDRGTWHLMTGRPLLLRLALGIRGPRQPVLGHDVAGTVVAVGQAVTRFAAGDEVYGFGQGSFAEYAVAREDKLARKPANAAWAQAARDAKVSPAAHPFVLFVSFCKNVPFRDPVPIGMPH